MSDYCRAVLRPEGIACTLLAGHEPYVSGEGWTTDHVNLVKNWLGGRPTREGVLEWGFNNPLGRKLEEESVTKAKDRTKMCAGHCGDPAMSWADFCGGDGQSCWNQPG